MEVDGGRKVRLPASHRSSKADIGRGIREAEMWVLLGVSGVMGAYHWGQGGSFRPRRRRRRRRWRGLGFLCFLSGEDAFSGSWQTRGPSAGEGEPEPGSAMAEAVASGWEAQKCREAPSRRS